MAALGQASFDKYESLAAGTGEWKTRKINLFQVLKGFVSQLKLGQDLTKVSLPAELCHPYTMLEIIALRQIITFRHLFAANSGSTELDRFMKVLRWYIGTIQQETFEKKPFNPVIGENHICWVQNSDESVTEFIGEQVSHHPPVSAYIVRNSAHEIKLNGTISFGVRFGSNQVSVSTAGAQYITLEKFNEKYEMAPKCIPDMVVRNVVFGKKYIMWDGDITISCPTTGYSATLSFSEKSKENIFKATVNHIDQTEPVYELFGQCSGCIYFQEPLQPNTKQLLIDVSKEELDPVYFLPKEHQDSLASVQCWRKVYKAIIDNDMPTADKEKKIVEQDQRDRSKQREEAGTLDRGMFFQKDEDGDWAFSGTHSVLAYLSNPSASYWPRSSGTGVAVAPQTPSVQTSLQLPSSSSSSSSTQTTSPRKEKEKDVTNQKDDVSTPSKAKARTDDDIAPESPKNLVVPTQEAQHSHSDSEVQNINSDDDEFHSSTTLNSHSSETVASVQSDSISKIKRQSSNQPTGSPQLASTVSIGSMSVPSTPTKSHQSSRELRQEKKKVREEQKIVYAKVKLEKKRNSDVLAQSSLSTIATGWVKMRNSLKKWQPRWVVLQPNRMIYFRGHAEVEKDVCSGILNLAGCEVRKRPSKKDGFCFKIFHLAQYPIYAKQGLKGETLKKALLPVGADYCIMRVNDEQDRNRWIEAIRQAIPDYDRVKQLSSVVDNSDSESEDDEEDEDEVDQPTAAEFTSLAEPSSSSTDLVSTSQNQGVAQGPSPKLPREAALDIKDLVKQMGQLYNKQRRLNSHQKEFNQSFEEFKKSQLDRIAALEKSVLFQLKQMAQQQQQRALQADKDAKQAAGFSAIGKRLKSDPIIALQLLFSLFILFSMVVAMRS